MREWSPNTMSATLPRFPNAASELGLRQARGRPDHPHIRLRICQATCRIFLVMGTSEVPPSQMAH